MQIVRIRYVYMIWQLLVLKGFNCDAYRVIVMHSKVVNICMGVGLSALLACALSEDGSGLLINVEEGDRYVRFGEVL